MRDGPSPEALQWRQMVERVFGEALTPIAAEGRIEQLKARAAGADRTTQALADRTR